MNFSDRLAHAIQAKKNPTVMGLDPKLDFVPQSVIEQAQALHSDPFAAAAAATLAFNCGLIDAVYDIIPAIKPQLAYYEMLGISGITAFQETICYARKKGMLVIVDGKRNDIGPTAEAYASAYLGQTLLHNGLNPVFDGDALTVNGYLGEDGIIPFLKACVERDKGIFVLVKTSNPSSGQLQDMHLADGRMVCEAMADLVNEWGESLLGNCGYSSVGAVVGATWPKQLLDMRKRMGKAWILVPGYGAQGGTAKDVALAFDQDGLGAVVNASRSLMCAWKNDKWRTRFGPDQYALACRAEAIQMRDEIMAAVNERGIT